LATCLKSSYLVADAIFLVDNQRYAMKNAPITHNLAHINERIVMPFFNLLCAGEEKRSKHIGAKSPGRRRHYPDPRGWTNNRLRASPNIYLQDYVQRVTAISAIKPMKH